MDNRPGPAGHPDRLPAALEDSLLAAIQRWLASVRVDIILLLAAFAAGWLFGRFGGKRRRSDDERNARNITQAQKK